MSVESLVVFERVQTAQVLCAVNSTMFSLPAAGNEKNRPTVPIVQALGRRIRGHFRAKCLRDILNHGYRSVGLGLMKV